MVKKINTQIFIANAISIHGNKYDYSNSVYKSSDTKLEIVCPIHGIFFQRPNSHLAGAGCKKCGLNIRKKKPITDYKIILDKFKSIHGELYNYSLAFYSGIFSKIKIICKFHGVFEQTPSAHLKGRGCAKCSHMISKAENKWIEELIKSGTNIQQHSSLKINGKRFVVDGFDNSTNTIYEFYGDFWHGNPKIHNRYDINRAAKKAFGELYDKTLKREFIFKNAGFNVVSIWENEFNA